MNKKRINKAIEHTGLVIEGNQWDGLHYFLNKDGDQVGDSVYVCYLNQQSIKTWVRDAEYALEQGVA